MCTNHDAYYWKTTHRATSLILGISRARFGISPKVLQEELNLAELPLNIAFDLNYSPFGEIYYSFVKKKLKRTKQKNIHILGVSVGSLSNREGELEMSREKEGLPQNLRMPNMHPNLEYILLYKNFRFAFKKLRSYEEKEKEYIYHENGWTEAAKSTKDFKIDENAIKHDLISINPDREKNLIKTIDLLKKTGTVFLVRLPAEKKAINSENKYAPDFNQRMHNIAQKQEVIYLDYTSSNIKYPMHDHYHLSGEGAKIFTKELSLDIKEYLEKYDNL